MDLAKECDAKHTFMGIKKIILPRLKKQKILKNNIIVIFQDFIMH
jgi:hypothetical protein